jgi:hypothetical protein
MKKLLAFVLVLMMVFLLLPLSVAGEGNVAYVTLENTTFTEPYNGEPPASGWTRSPSRFFRAKARCRPLRTRLRKTI